MQASLGMDICELAKPECNPSGGSSAKSSHMCFACANALLSEAFFPLAQTSIDPFNRQLLFELQAEGSDAKQTTEPCGIFLIPTARKTAKLDRDTLS